MSNPTATLQANKGEWSELYVLFKVFDERYVAAADADLRPIDDKGYNFLKVIREEIAGQPISYDLTQGGVVKITNGEGKLLKTVLTRDLSSKTKTIFKSIKSAQNSSFEMKDTIALMQEFLISKVKANSLEKTDILAVIPDKIGGTNSELGFSIKSHVGGAPTLVNSSSHTNFVYEVSGFTGDITAVNSIEGSYKVRKRIGQIKAGNGEFKFIGITSSTFNSNLRLADTSLPNLMGQLLLDYYSGKGSDWAGLSRIMSGYKDIDINEQEMVNILKSFLRAAALGMVPATEWDTKLSAYGGYIVVLDDGSLVCYHLLNDDEFREYLFENTKFDTPSTGRYDFGNLYEEGGKLMMNLNLQIRFLK